MDSLGSLALATEPPKEELLKRPPYKRDEYIISHKMVKHILGNSIYQVIVLLAIILFGEYWFPEPMKEFQSEFGPYVFPGRPYNWDLTELYKEKEYEWGPSRHLTNVFNVFVFMTIFNMISARKIHDEINIFDGITKNMMYAVIILIICGGQILIVLFGGKAFKVSTIRPSVSGSQWGMAIAFGFGNMLWDTMLKFVPDGFCPQFGKK